VQSLISSAGMEWQTLSRWLTQSDTRESIARFAAVYDATLTHGGTIFFAGNGGSAADAQHIAAEYVIRFMRNRRGLSALALTVDTSVLTACGNDFGYDLVFARQLEALSRPDDLLVVHSTSGNSPNLIQAVDAAAALGVSVRALLGGTGGRLGELLGDRALIVPSQVTARIQEMHVCIEHLIVEWVERHVGV
jgi:D-sedoheptulose 7-phosphate isomerase